MYKNYLSHHGILGQKWGVRRYQNYDGTRIRKRGKSSLKDLNEIYNTLSDDEKRLVSATPKDQKPDKYFIDPNTYDKYTSAYWLVRKDNTKSINLAEKNGFKNVGYSQGRKDWVWYKKNLSKGDRKK